MPQTALITLISPGADTGPSFDLKSNADSYASIFEPGVLKTSLVAGYTSTLVPSGATIIRVQSTGVCTSFIDLSIIGLNTTTTTTVAPGVCVAIQYAYDASSGEAACSLYPASATAYYWNGVNLRDPQLSGTGCNGTISATGYYSDGFNYYYWNGVSFNLVDTCSNPQSTVNVYLKRYAGSSTKLYLVYYATRQGGGAWSEWTLLNSINISTNYVMWGTFSVPSGSDIVVGIAQNLSVDDIAYTELSNPTPVWCGKDTTTSWYKNNVTQQFLSVYLTADTEGTVLPSCSGPG